MTDLQLERLNSRLHEAQSRLREHRRLEAKLHHQRTLADHAATALQRHAAVLAKEQAEVDKLEGLTLTGLFYALIGAKQERLKTEHEELLAAKLKHDEQQGALLDLEHNIDELVGRLASSADAPEEFERAQNDKANYLKRTDTEISRKLLKLTQQLADLESDRKEIAEAVVAGRSALRELRRLETTLRSAGKWGTFDLLGGGLIATMAKHSRMNDAKHQVRCAQRHLRQFTSEMQDVGRDMSTALEVSGLMTFADYFFDGLIADWIVQGRIDAGKQECRKALAKVRAGLDECENIDIEKEDERRKLAEERERLIAEA